MSCGSFCKKLRIAKCDFIHVGFERKVSGI
jgi:hypothetical protein